MSDRSRYLEAQIEADLQRKMVFVAGPRRVGKTTLARSLPGAEAGYLNWDIPEHRERILRRQLPPSPLWIFDEIHKYRFWRNYLKGLYDGKAPGQRILVTGSARLDYYRYSGDSLQGRYHLLHLHPLSLAELGMSTPEELQTLLTLGGFPEPFFSGSEVEARRWSREHRNLINREKFRLAPFGSPSIRATEKEQKHYHFDWTLVPEPAARFENLVASHLLKWAQYQQDTQGLDLELRYFRDVDGREVDFVLTERRKPLALIECKLSDTEIDKGLRYLKTRFPQAEAWQISATGSRDFVSPEGIRVCPAPVYLAGLV